jgi:hypothetical protein
MHRATRLLLTFLTFSFLYVASASVARADSVVVNITNPVQTLMVGFSGSFSGSLTNTSASPVTISGTLLTLTILGPVPDTLIVLDFADAYLDLVSPLRNGPLTLAPGESTGVIPLFEFDLIHTFSGPLPVTINGMFIVSNGDPFIPANQLGSANWTITALTNPNPVPEPATVLLLGAGLVGVVGKAYRKRRAR